MNLVKIFTDVNLECMENDINIFMSNPASIDGFEITSIQYSSCIGRHARIHYSAFIMYKIHAYEQSKWIEYCNLENY